MVNFLKSIYGRWNAFHPGLELQRQVQRVVTRLVQVPTVKPQRLLLRRLPHVALLALPWTWVLGGFGTETPHLADLVGNLLGDKVGRPAVHRTVSGGIDDDI